MPSAEADGRKKKIYLIFKGLTPTEEPAKPGTIITFGDGRLKAEVALKVMRAGKEIMLAVASYGDNWYESKSSLELILDDQKEIEFIISHLDSRKKRVVSVPLTGFPKRPERTTRIQMNIGFTDENTMAVVIRDKGFGELFPATDTVIRQEVIL